MVDGCPRRGADQEVEGLVEAEFCPWHRVEEPGTGTVQYCTR